jgi:hypothetical protein
MTLQGTLQYSNHNTVHLTKGLVHLIMQNAFSSSPGVVTASTVSAFLKSSSSREIQNDN